MGPSAATTAPQASGKDASVEGTESKAAESKSTGAESDKATPADTTAADKAEEAEDSDLPNGATDADTIAIDAQVSGGKNRNSKASRSRNSLR